MKYFTQLGLIFGSVALLTACGKDKRSTGLEYASQMYHSIPVESYSQLDYFKPTNNWTYQGKTMREPVAGTITYGNGSYAYPFPNTNEGYEAAGKELKNPLPYTKAHHDEGKRLYEQYCTHCHGEAGAGDGSVINSKKFGNPGAYNARLKDRTEGMVFHSITYGKNLMGSHASQLSPLERWQVAHYVKKLQGNQGEPGEAAPVDSTSKSVAVDSSNKKVAGK